MRLVSVTEIVIATEQRFPQHNGPFEYGTRLAEEVGELIEAAYEAWGNEEGLAQPHLVRELADVLRVTMGIARHYEVDADTREALHEYRTSSPPITVLECIAHVGAASCGLAKAINHAEGVGIKADKHEINPITNLRQAAERMLQAIADAAELFNLSDRLTLEVAQTLCRYRERGFVASPD